MSRRLPFLPRMAIAGLRSATDFWSSVATTISGWMGAYTATDPRRKPLLGKRPMQATANQVLTANLLFLRAHCRQLERNNPVARAAVEGIVAIVVGNGIALEPDTGDAAADKIIRKEWLHWISTCSVDGRDLYHLQQQAMREIVIAGEFIWRIVTLPERGVAGDVPTSVLPLEAEWIAESNLLPIYMNNTYRVGGIDMDMLGRPQLYNLINPEFGGNAMGVAEAVKAADIIHGFEKRRSLQARGEPWFAPIVETLYVDWDIITTEMQTAKNASGYAVAIKSEIPNGGNDTDQNSDPVTDIPIGSVVNLLPGDSVETIKMDRPGTAIAPFRAMLRGDIAGCMRVPRRYLDRDIKGASYSSHKTDIIDEERLLGPTRRMLGHGTAGRLYQRVLPLLALRAGIPTPKQNKYRLIPDEMPSNDPKKDIDASITAMNAKLSTGEKEIGRRGEDYQKVQEQIERETAEADAALLRRITRLQVGITAAKQLDPNLKLTWAEILAAGGALTAPGAFLEAVAAAETAESAANAGPAESEDAPAEE